MWRLYSLARRNWWTIWWVWVGGVPLPTGGEVPLPRKIFGFIISKWWAFVHSGWYYLPFSCLFCTQNGIAVSVSFSAVINSTALLISRTSSPTGKEARSHWTSERLELVMQQITDLNWLSNTPRPGRSFDGEHHSIRWIK